MQDLLAALSFQAVDRSFEMTKAAAKALVQ
jgi:hypothetical protein